MVLIWSNLLLVPLCWSIVTADDFDVCLLNRSACDLADDWTSALQVSKRYRVNPEQTQKSRIKFLRIQKTGGTTLGKHIMPSVCSDCYDASCHFDWNRVQDSDRVVTMLRHPVERTESEFRFLAHAKWAFDQTQWDVPKKFKHSVWTALKEGDISKYLNIKQNPSINRQTLYLAGFKQLDCNPGTCNCPASKIRLHSGKVVSLEEGIDWKQDGPELLERAKSHLSSSKITFGLTDDYICSMKHFSKTYDWPTDKVIAIAQDTHRRQQDKFSGPSEHESTGESIATWSDVINDKVKHEIEEANKFDMQLYAYARSLFEAKTRDLC